MTYSDSEGEDEEPLKVRPIPELPPPRDAGEAEGNVLGKPVQQALPQLHLYLADSWELRQSTPTKWTAEVLACIGRTIVEKVSGVARWAARATPPPEEPSTRKRGLRRARELWSHHGSPQLQSAQEGINLEFFVKVSAAAVWTPDALLQQCAGLHTADL